MFPRPDARSPKPRESGENDLLILAINLTRRCNTACAHCYLDAETLRSGSANELGTLEICRLLEEVAALDSGTMVVLTGGEPLVRRDLEELISHGAANGLSMVVGTNGTLLTDNRVSSLQKAGVLGLGISLDSLDAERHDAFRGLPGGWQRTMDGIESCRRHQLSFQIHFSVTPDNAHELGAMIEFAKTVGARVLNVFFLVCTGRGETFSDIPGEMYEEILGELIDAQQLHQDLIIRPRCAPHFKRLAWQRNAGLPINRISGREGDGCIAGTHYCRITPEGGVTACPYIPQEVGSIREQSFQSIWRHAPAFGALREAVLGGNCGACEFQKLCGGCRARPLAAGGNILDSDPFCMYEPSGAPTIEPLPAALIEGIGWTPEARQRLERVPAFLRRMVEKRAAAYVAGLGEASVTPEHLAVLSARRFGGARPK